MRFRKPVRLTIMCLVATLFTGCTIPHSLTSAPQRLSGRQLHLTADFDNVAGLYPGNAVSILGLQVGQVDSVIPRGHYVEVRMSLDRGTAVPADVIAALVSPQLITNRHIELTPAYTGKGPTLGNDGHIPLEHTRTPVELDRILRTFDEIGKSLAGDKTSGPMSSRVLFPLLQGNGDRIHDTLDALSKAFHTTLADKDQISDAIIRLNDLTEVIADNDRTVRDFSARLTQLISLMRDQAPGLQSVLTQLDDFVANTGAVVARNRQPLIDALQRLTTITAQMRNHGRELTEITDIAPLFFGNLAAAMSPRTGSIRLHLLTDKSLLDGEALSLLCHRVQLRADGCRTGKLTDFGPDFGLVAALLGLTR